MIRIQEKDAKAREERESERLKKIRDIRAAEKAAASRDTSNSTHWVWYSAACYDRV